MFENKNNSGWNAKQEKLKRDLEGLFLKNRHISFVVSGLLFVSFCVFMGGYFWGQKNAVESFTNKIGQESFSDQIYSSVCSLCDNGDIESNGEAEEGEEAASANACEQEKPADIVAQAEGANGSQEEKNDAVAESEVESAQSQYYAQLVGFGTAHAAQQFVQRLARKDITVLVKKRTSRTARGRFIAWYQVVSEKFDDKNELMQFVGKLKIEEKLKDIQVIAC